MRQQAGKDYVLASQSQQIQGMTRDAFRLAHFKMRGLPDAALTQRGTRPGDPVGDVCFNLVIQVPDPIVQDGIPLSVPWMWGPG